MDLLGAAIQACAGPRDQRLEVAFRGKGATWAFSFKANFLRERFNPFPETP